MSQMQIGQPNTQAIQRRLGSTLNATPMQMNPTAANPMTPAPVTAAAPGTTVPLSTPGVQLNSVTPVTAANPLGGGTGDPNLDKYLGTDATYQSQLSDLMKQFDDYNAQANLQASQTQADYDAKIKAMNTQTTQDQLNMRNAAAARGILYSGIYANELGQYNDANQQQMTNLLGGLQNSKDTATLARTQEIDNLESAKQNAIQQAAARRAASLGTI